MNTNTNSQPPAAGEAAHHFLTRLLGLLDEGEASDVVWNYCIENAKAAQSDAANVFNLHGKRTGKDEVVVRGAPKGEVAALVEALERICKLQSYGFVIPNQATGTANAQTTLTAFAQARAALKAAKGVQ